MTVATHDTGTDVHKTAGAIDGVVVMISMTGKMMVKKTTVKMKVKMQKMVMTITMRMVVVGGGCGGCGGCGVVGLVGLLAVGAEIREPIQRIQVAIRCTPFGPKHLRCWYFEPLSL